MGHAAIGISGAENISTTFPKAIPKLLLCSPPELRSKSFSGGVYVRATAKHTWKLGNTTNKFFLFVAETTKSSNTQFKAE